MTIIGYHASQEQFSPSELLSFVRQAEQEGFESVMSADHFNPWSERQGQSAFTWTWLGAAMQATTLPFGSLAIPGGWRYHPAILAQAIATLAQMFPARLEWIAAGSGQALNERVVGANWPSKEIRNRRLLDGISIMRMLWAGETVNKEDGDIRVLQARLWTLPPTAPKVLAAALSPETAKWAGTWADGLITVNQPPEKLESIIAAFRQGGGQGKPLYLQLHLSWDESDGQALENAYDQWSRNIFPFPLSEALHTTALYDAAATFVRPEDMHEHMLVSADLHEHAKCIQRYERMGFDHIYLHNVGRNQQAFIETFGRHVLPALKGAVEKYAVEE